MKNVVFAVFLMFSAGALGQSTVQITCTTPSCGATTLQSNGFSATGTGGAGGVSMTAGGAPSIPNYGLTTSSITLFAPSTVTTAYGVAPGGTAATGLWYGTLGSGANFSSYTVTVTSGVITGFTGTYTGGAGYFTPPPCYFTTTAGYTTPSVCTFNVSGGAISGVNLVPNTGTGSGYTANTVTVNAGPVLDLSYLTASDSTYLLNSSGIVNSGYNVQISNGTLTNGDLGSFNGQNDLVDSNIAATNVPLLNAANSFTANNTFSGIILSGITITGVQGNGSLAQLSTGTFGANRLIKFDSNGNTVNSDLLESSNNLNNNGAGTSWRISGGGDGNANSTLGSLTASGADETGSGGSSSKGGGLLLRGGNNAATNASSQAGSAELLGGQSTGSTQGIQGLVLIADSYIKGTTVTQWDLQCESANGKVSNCAGTNAVNWVCVAETVNSTTVFCAVPGSQVPITATGAVTLGHTVCAGNTTAGEITDSGGTGVCTAGLTAGVVMYTSGSFTYADGTTVTATTTLPIIQLMHF
jgi:hypothetical protein